jgi:GNAT superfamily N-acetyltransferase
MPGKCKQPPHHENCRGSIDAIASLTGLRLQDAASVRPGQNDLAQILAPNAGLRRSRQPPAGHNFNVFNEFSGYEPGAPLDGARFRDAGAAELMAVDSDGKLTSAMVQTFESHIKDRHEGVVFDLMVARHMLAGNAIELTWIIVPDRQQGVGTAIMRELCEFADHHAAEISLTPASKGDYAATTSRARLIRFYKRFGFAADRRKPGEIAGIPVLVRKPLMLN